MSYREEQVHYKNEVADITLAGTLTLPSGKEKNPPAILLIAGMGPNDRDYTMMGHKLFLDLSRYLAKRGIASLRYDKRGVGASSGTFNTKLTSHDFAQDALAGVHYLMGRNDINTLQIGVLGHSEGGMIAPMVALETRDISFLILMAGVVATSIQDNVKQVGMQMRADGASETMIKLDAAMRTKVLEIISNEENYDIAATTILEVINTYLKALPDEQKEEIKRLPFSINEENKDQVINLFNSPWYRYFISYNPVDALEQLRASFLAIYGALDFITSSKVALPLIEKAIRKHNVKGSAALELPGHNHWLQLCTTGSLTEYGTIKQTMSEESLSIMVDWILACIGN